MLTYEAPLADLRFAYNALGAADALAECPSFAEVTPDLIDAVLDEAGKFAAEVLFPLNRSGDEAGCVFDDGEVKTPNGFKEAYASWVENGWSTLTAHPEYGGQGLPGTVSWMVQEMFCATNMAFSMYPGLTHGAYEAIAAHGNEALKSEYLPRLATGEWAGTMCLTEPQCGTDLGLIRTKAEPIHGTDGYRISGSKIFISAGEHDLAENIVHLVLARLPDAPPGIGGITLFLVPKFLPGPDGEPGERNGVVCTAIEHKMGIKASSTCALAFDEATGFLVGRAHRGMRAMFTMMNAARLGVGVQGLSLAEAAYQGAVGYARERLQGRSLKGAKYPELAADPIIVHPDVRRLLLTMRAFVEGARALSVWTGSQIDLARHHPDEGQRQASEDFVQLLTPVVKAFFTDIGFDVANMGVQVFGGHGYIREHGMEQFVRDARITQIYEGTNGVQALDLVGRKLSANMGRSLRQFFHPIADFIADKGDDEDLAEFIAPLEKAFGRLQRATARIAEEGLNDPDEAGAAATDYLKLFGYVALGYMWTRMAQEALSHQGDDPDGFYAAKVRTARFYVERLLPMSNGHFAALMAGGSSIMEFADDAF